VKLFKFEKFKFLVKIAQNSNFLSQMPWNDAFWRRYFTLFWGSKI